MANYIEIFFYINLFYICNNNLCYSKTDWFIYKNLRELYIIDTPIFNLNGIEPFVDVT